MQNAKCNRRLHFAFCILSYAGMSISVRMLQQPALALILLADELERVLQRRR